jgi:hypothetical protein
MTEKTPPVAASAEDVAAFRTEQQKEWGQYIALTDISFNGARAYNAGDPVPASNVEKHKYLDQGLVTKVATKAGQDLIASIQPSEPTEVPPPVSLGVPVK